MSFVFGLVTGVVVGPILIYLFKFGYKKLKGELGPVEKGDN
jgi:hypothetical protein